MDTVNIPEDIEGLQEAMELLEDGDFFKNPTYLNSFRGYLERMDQISTYYGDALLQPVC